MAALDFGGLVEGILFMGNHRGVILTNDDDTIPSVRSGYFTPSVSPYARPFRLSPFGVSFIEVLETLGNERQ